MTRRKVIQGSAVLTAAAMPSRPRGTPGGARGEPGEERPPRASGPRIDSLCDRRETEECALNTGGTVDVSPR